MTGVLLYHRIADLNPDHWGLCTPPDVFRRQLRELREYCDIEPLDSLLTSPAHAGRRVAITFDDGFLDTLTTALPVLEELDIPATLFVNKVTASPREQWWDSLEAAVNNWPHGSLRIRASSTSSEYHTRSPEERCRTVTAVRDVLWTLNAAEREDVLRQVGDGMGAVRQSHRTLTRHELQALARHPLVTIGAHTSNHLCLPSQDEATQIADIVPHRADLEDLIGRRVDLFAYPYGCYDASCIDVVRAGGFRAAFTVDTALVTGSSQPFTLPRIECGRSGLGFRNLKSLLQIH